MKAETIAAEVELDFVFLQLGQVKGSSGWVSKIGSLPIDTAPSIAFLHNEVNAQRTIVRGSIADFRGWIGNSDDALCRFLLDRERWLGIPRGGIVAVD